MKRYVAEIAACLVVVLALGLLAFWFARLGPGRGEAGECLDPVEIAGPSGAALWCGRDVEGLEAVVTQAGAPGCQAAVADGLAGLPSGTARLAIDSDCRVLQVRPGILSGRASLLLGIPLDLNLADVSDLEELPGIGPKMAARIVDDRTKNGSFCSVEELDRVKGIGKKTVERLGPMLSASCR